MSSYKSSWMRKGRVLYVVGVTSNGNKDKGELASRSPTTMSDGRRRCLPAVLGAEWCLMVVPCCFALPPCLAYKTGRQLWCSTTIHDTRGEIISCLPACWWYYIYIVVVAAAVVVSPLNRQGRRVISLVLSYYVSLMSNQKSTSAYPFQFYPNSQLKQSRRQRQYNIYI